MFKSKQVIFSFGIGSLLLHLVVTINVWASGGATVREISHICVKAMLPTFYFAWGTTMPLGKSQVISALFPLFLTPKRGHLFYCETWYHRDKSNKPQTYTSRENSPKEHSALLKVAIMPNSYPSLASTDGTLGCFAFFFNCSWKFLLSGLHFGQSSRGLYRKCER